MALNNQIVLIMAALSIASYNSHGHGVGRFEYLNSILNNHDIVLVQEHWLLQDQLVMFENRINGINVHGISGMNNDTLVEGRPYGGCAILWKSSILCKVNPINVESK